MTRPRTPHLLGASVLGLALVSVSAFPAVAGGDGPSVTKDGSTYTLKLLETDDGSHDTYIPKGGEPIKGEPKGAPEAGDGFGFGAVLTQDGTKVGTDGGTCTVLSIDVKAQTGVSHCRVTLTFANGTITVEGTVKFDETSTFDVPIVSGTGDYAGATGTMTVHDVSGDSGDDEESDGPSISDLTAVYTLGGSQVSEVPSGGAATGGGTAGTSSDNALVIGLGVLAALGGIGVLAGGRTLAARRD
jgi:hypothetical protein